MERRTSGLFRRAAIVAVIAALAGGCCDAEAEAEASGTISAVRLAKQPALDSELIDMWSTTKGLTSFTSFTTGKPAALSTAVWLGYDDANLYLRFRCAIDAAAPTVSGNVDDLRAAAVDYVGFQIDPSGNGSRIYEFDSTSNGLRYQTSSESSLYQPDWRAAGRLQQGNYFVAMAIPLANLRSDTASASHWKVNFVRHIASLNEDLTFAYNAGVTDLRHDARYWKPLVPIVVGKRATRPSPSAELYLLSAAGEDRALSRTNGSRNAGLDFKVPVTNTSALVGTIDPDFSNVDRDQITIAPQEFRLQLDETRPFFAQGKSYVAPLAYAGIAATPVQMFYTPSIGIFNRGVKYEGTAGRFQFGVLDAATERNDDRAYGLQYSNEQHALAIAVQGVGAVHGRYHDTTTGYSVFIQNPHNGFFVGTSEMLETGSFTTTPSAARASVTSVGIHNRRWNFGIGEEAVGPEFAPFDAYVSNNDIRGRFALASYTANPDRGLKSYNVQYLAASYKNWGGAMAEADSLLSATATTRSLFSVRAFANTSALGLYDKGYPVYTGQTFQAFDSAGIALGWRDGTATPVHFSYSVGPFGAFCGGTGAAICSAPQKGGAVDAFVRQLSFLAARPIGRGYAVSLEYDGTVESARSVQLSDSQWLRRISVSRSVGKRGSFNLALRQINGRGGFTTPGVNLSAGLNAEFKDLDRLYFEFGSPSNARTLNRFIVKYVVHVGSGQGT
ncbi:MAG: hypothetical protein M3N13_01685 [Candidatus Eremiobacteraeota bacterium]|nr:hypothetical protein [Candidatus Eremiobacteraeota bacterium]